MDKSDVPEKEFKAFLKRWVQHWTDELAVVHAHYLACGIYHRAVACKEAQNPSYRRASTVRGMGTSGPGHHGVPWRALACHGVPRLAMACHAV
jgi:hypothetical protein